MADGRTKAEWQHTSSLLAMIHNLFADEKNRLAPSDFDPTRPKIKVPKEHFFAALRGAFVAKSIRDPHAPG
jgi:hypothetical protein